jgi:glycosyltransferase involved in cell wall biosynthesis
MKLDVVIATYNRPKMMNDLVEELLKHKLYLDKVIVVDSSEQANNNITKYDEVIYVTSTHVNQPYQRLLGAHLATNEWVIFLDDDMQINNPHFAKILIEHIQRDNQLVGIGSHVSNETFTTPFWKSLLLSLTGVPVTERGRLNLFGYIKYKSSHQKNVITQEYLHGGFMCFKKEFFIKSVPNALLSVYEKKWGRGEDKLISFLASSYGRLLLIEQILWLDVNRHNSSYFVNYTDAQARIIYSRRFIAEYIGKKRKLKSWQIEIQFLYFWIWRVIINLIKTLAFNKKSLQKFRGDLLGIWRYYQNGIHPEKITPGMNWESEVAKDLNKYFLKYSFIKNIQ